MGCDGGTIPRRDELVRTKKKPEQKNKDSELAFKWKHCAISQERLVKPFVACQLGRLYNKEAVVQYLLDKSQMEVSTKFKHLRGLRDIKEVNVTENPEKRKFDNEKGDAYVDSGASEYICPVVGIEMSGKHRFSMIWKCGCVMSERALKEVKSNACHKCGKTFEETDVVILNPEDDDLEAMKVNMSTRRFLAKKSSKGAKKDSTQQKECESKTTSSSSSPSTLSPSSSQPAGQESDAESLTNGHSSKTANHGQAGSSAQTSSRSTIGSKAKSALNGLPSKPGKLISQGGPRGGGAGAQGGLVGVKRKGGIQSNPSASKTYKSLFTTSEAAKSQQQPHWITFNPMYY